MPCCRHCRCCAHDAVSILSLKEPAQDALPGHPDRRPAHGQAPLLTERDVQGNAGRTGPFAPAGPVTGRGPCGASARDRQGTGHEQEGHRGAVNEEPGCLTGTAMSRRQRLAGPDWTTTASGSTPVRGAGRPARRNGVCPGRPRRRHRSGPDRVHQQPVRRTRCEGPGTVRHRDRLRATTSDAMHPAPWGAS